ncbi:hypothetical protein ACHQM5_014982 [Ranunculus cassubicifolius]
MQVFSNIRKLSNSLLQSQKSLLSNSQITSQWRNLTTFSSQISTLSDTRSSTVLGPHPMYSIMSRVSYTSESTAGGPTEGVKEIYDKMLKSVEGQTAPPNAWLWSLVEKCGNRDDIALLFQMLQNLRRFRLSNLRIHENFNCTLCSKVAQACARVGAMDYGKKALWQHNKYGLTPSVSSANYLLAYAKEHNDSKLMVELMQLMKRNHLPLQPSTADIIFSICYNVNDWDLISKYAHKFNKAGVKLRRTTFGTWMEFAARQGDVESIWKIEELRSKAMEKHNLATAFSCAKGFLLQGKPENAAAIVHVLYEKLPEEKKTGVSLELQKLVSEWPLEVVQNQKEEEEKKKLATSLEKDIPAMINNLISMGLAVQVSLEDLKKIESIPS